MLTDFVQLQNGPESRAFFCMSILAISSTLGVNFSRASPTQALCDVGLTIRERRLLVEPVIHHLPIQLARRRPPRPGHTPVLAGRRVRNSPNEVKATQGRAWLSPRGVHSVAAHWEAERADGLSRHHPHIGHTLFSHLDNGGSMNRPRLMILLTTLSLVALLERELRAGATGGRTRCGQERGALRNRLCPQADRHPVVHRDGKRYQGSGQRPRRQRIHGRPGTGRPGAAGEGD